MAMKKTKAVERAEVRPTCYMMYVCVFITNKAELVTRGEAAT